MSFLSMAPLTFMILSNHNHFFSNSYKPLTNSRRFATVFSSTNIQTMLSSSRKRNRQRSSYKTTLLGTYIFINTNYKMIYRLGINSYSINKKRTFSSITTRKFNYMSSFMLYTPLCHNLSPLTLPIKTETSSLK